MWTDGSKLGQGNVGAAVSWKDKDLTHWKVASVFLGKNKEILDAELWAIDNAIKMARKNALNNHVIPIKIFSDSQEALTSILQSISHIGSPYLRDLIHQRTLAFKKKGHLATIRWISCHVGLLGHEKADIGAKDRAHTGGRPVEQWSSLNHIKKKLTESLIQELAQWHEVETSVREASRRGFYIPSLDGGMNKLLGSTAKKYSSRFLQLKVGHGAVGTFWQE